MKQYKVMIDISAECEDDLKEQLEELDLVYEWFTEYADDEDCKYTIFREKTEEDYRKEKEKEAKYSLN